MSSTLHFFLSLFDHYAKFGCCVTYRMGVYMVPKTESAGAPPAWDGTCLTCYKHAPFTHVTMSDYVKSCGPKLGVPNMGVLRPPVPLR